MQDEINNGLFSGDGLLNNAGLDGIPLLGDELKNLDGGQFINGLFDKIEAGLTEIEDESVDVVREKLFKLFHEEASILKDINNDGTVPTIDEIEYDPSTSLDNFKLSYIFPFY